jgi:Tfp pilus assembly protein PilV
MTVELSIKKNTCRYENLSTGRKIDRRQRGDALLEGLIAILLMAIIGLGMTYVLARAANSQKNLNVQNLTVGQIQATLQNAGVAAGCPASGSATSTFQITLTSSQAASESDSHANSRAAGASDSHANDHAAGKSDSHAASLSESIQKECSITAVTASANGVKKTAMVPTVQFSTTSQSLYGNDKLTVGNK